MEKEDGVTRDQDQHQTLVEEAITRAIGGDRQASEQLLPLVYQELRQLASSYLRHDRPGHTLQPTALVHEVYLRLARSEEPGWEGKRHFFGAAANAMRQIIIEHARRRLTAKRGGDKVIVGFEDSPFHPGATPEDLLALDEALQALETNHPRLSQVVVLRYFGGLSEEDTADLLGVTTRTIRRDWILAKAFLAEAFEGDAA